MWVIGRHNDERFLFIRQIQRLLYCAVHEERFFQGQLGFARVVGVVDFASCAW